MTTLPPSRGSVEKTAVLKNEGKTYCKSSPRVFGAGKGVRTLDLNLGKVALYQLSYSRGATHFKGKTNLVQAPLSAALLRRRG